MKHLLITIFIVLILSFGIIGLTQTLSDEKDTIDDNGQAVIVDET